MRCSIGSTDYVSVEQCPQAPDRFQHVEHDISPDPNDSVW